MTLEIRELVIEARIVDAAPAVAMQNAETRLTLQQEERLIEEVVRRVLTQLREELRENGERHL
ncbi:hypothetical protein KPG66_12520 [Mycetohabitans sp. B2]|uniref:DUF5908 family protein n=1 Tax=Mycetohabitans sp. B2 TaxID=2841274 RepID=UPI001F2F1395|nr:DUF5908 family protein [Mycetohabitans sp. B2]MCF7696884.1 hypothetical protein [Mycetohabitans sp. B2]